MTPCHATFPVPTFVTFPCPPPTRPTSIPPALLLLPHNVSEVQTFLSSPFPGLHPASGSQQSGQDMCPRCLRRTRHCSPLGRVAGQAETAVLRRRTASHRRKQRHVLKCPGRGRELAERPCRAGDRGSECGVQGRLAGFRNGVGAGLRENMKSEQSLRRRGSLPVTSMGEEHPRHRGQWCKGPGGRCLPGVSAVPPPPPGATLLPPCALTSSGSCRDLLLIGRWAPPRLLRLGGQTPVPWPCPFICSGHCGRFAWISPAASGCHPPFWVLAPATVTRALPPQAESQKYLCPPCNSL